MKVFLITKEPFPHGMAAVKRIVAYAKAWAMSDVDCEILIYTRTEKFGIKPKNIQGKGFYVGIPFKYLSGSPLRERSALIRRLNDILDFYRLKIYLANNLKKGDIVYEYGRNLKNVSIIGIAHKHGAKYIHELCELPYGTGDETSKTISNRKAFEKNIMPNLDGVIAISDTLTEYAKNHCQPTCHIAKVPILVDFRQYDMPDRSDEAEIPYIFHSGTLFEQKDGFVSMLKAFGQSVERLSSDVRFISTGRLQGSKHEQEIRDIIAQYNIQDKVIFTGYLSDDELREYLAKAAFVVINKLTTQQNKYCFSTKLGEYMAASKPIIITSVGEAMNWLTHGKDAYVIPPNNIEVLSEAMQLFFEDKSLRKRLSSNANETCKRYFSIESNAEKLYNAISTHL